MRSVEHQRDVKICDIVDEMIRNRNNFINIIILGIIAAAIMVLPAFSCKLPA